MGVVVKVSGPLVVAEGLQNAKMYDVVRVGQMQLIGEIIEIDREQVSIQVYEETAGVGPGEPVVSTNEPLSVTLGPGMLTGIFDGIQRPLEKIQGLSGNFIARGITVPALDIEKNGILKLALVLARPLFLVKSWAMSRKQNWCA